MMSTGGTSIRDSQLSLVGWVEEHSDEAQQKDRSVLPRTEAPQPISGVLRSARAGCNPPSGPDTILCSPTLPQRVSQADRRVVILQQSHPREMLYRNRAKGTQGVQWISHP